MSWLAALDDFRNWLIREAGLNGLFLIGSPRFREVSPNSDSAFAGVIDCVDLVNPLKHL
jgi:hypothetical protein